MTSDKPKKESPKGKKVSKAPIKAADPVKRAEVKPAEVPDKQANA